MNSPALRVIVLTSKQFKSTVEFELAIKLRPSFVKAHCHFVGLYQRNVREELAQKEIRAVRALKAEN